LELEELNPQTQSDELLSFVSENKGKNTNGRTKEGQMIDKFSIQSRQFHVMSRGFAYRH
jgi:hypothetical protein